jgi:GNAT superfamily N-acetyltransferase
VIRPAVAGDIPTIARLGKEFHAEAAWSDIVEYNEDDCAAALTNLLHAGIMLVAEEDGGIIGIAGGVVTPIYFNHAHVTGEELFLWVKPERRGQGARLLKALEDAARGKGCQSWGMKSLATVNPERMDTYYRRNGYRPSEQSYIKRL